MQNTGIIRRCLKCHRCLIFSRHINIYQLVRCMHRTRMLNGGNSNAMPHTNLIYWNTEKPNQHSICQNNLCVYPSARKIFTYSNTAQCERRRNCRVDVVTGDSHFSMGHMLSLDFVLCACVCVCLCVCFLVLMFTIAFV